MIAGTPLAWGFDPATKTLRLRYSTARVAGAGRFAAGALTEIATPALVYGGRWAAHVSGGAIVSARGASVLQIAACRGARSISVTVLRSGRSHGACHAPSRHAHER